MTEHYGGRTDFDDEPFGKQCVTDYFLPVCPNHPVSDAMEHKRIPAGHGQIRSDRRPAFIQLGFCIFHAGHIQTQNPGELDGQTYALCPALQMAADQTGRHSH